MKRQELPANMYHAVAVHHLLIVREKYDFTSLILRFHPHVRLAMSVKHTSANADILRLNVDWLP